MILLLLFWIFFKIGLFTIGGGYAMISTMSDEVVSRGWASEELVAMFIGVAESTPGPLAINMATFIGFHQYGLLGAIVSTLSVVLPSFIVILIVAKMVDKFLENRIVKYVVDGIKAAVVGLIGATALYMIYELVLEPAINQKDISLFDYKAIIIMVIVMVLSKVKIKSKKASPIILILVSAGLGMLLYGLIP